jgi:hypothetical protein
LRAPLQIWGTRISCDTYSECICKTNQHLPEILTDPLVHFDCVVCDLALPEGKRSRTVVFPMKITDCEFEIYRPQPAPASTTIKCSMDGCANSPEAGRCKVKSRTRLNVRIRFQ